MPLIFDYDTIYGGYVDICFCRDIATAVTCANSKQNGISNGKSAMIWLPEIVLF